MRTERLNRKRTIQSRKLLRAEIKNLEADLARKEANKRALVDEIAATMQTIDEKKAKLAELESRN